MHGIETTPIKSVMASLQLYEAEMRCALVEAETREEVMREMEERMRAVERTYALRLMSEVRQYSIQRICFAYGARQVERNERKMDAKIDMLHQAGLLGTAKKTVEVSHSESEIEDIVEDVSCSHVVMDPRTEPTQSAPEDSDQEYETDAESEMPSSPLQGKSNPITSKNMGHYNAQTEADGETNDHANDAISQNTDSEDGDEAEDIVLSTNDDASDDYIPPTTAKNTKDHKRGTRDKVSKKSTGKRSTRSVSKLEQEIQCLSIRGDALAEADDSVVILPKRKFRQATVEVGGPGTEDVPGKGEVDPTKKKKRCAG